MNLSDNLLPAQWYWFGHALLAILLIKTVPATPWQRLKIPANHNLWLGACVALMTIWSIKAGIKPGLNFHLLGATAFTLMFGPQLAIFGLLIVLAGVTLTGLGGWEAFSLNALIMIFLPVWLSYTLFRIVDQKLPNHFFIYIFINAFIGGAFAVTATGLASTWLLAAGDAYSLKYLYSQYLPYYILMSWSEAMSTGMIMTLMVVFRPQWVSTFDDERYIRNK
ncbi:energy-coupling factor ABC transporter permease [Sulfurirhabdus autotrophica]|uniref:Putative membrane protein n=1 Tax=Sulfurirhabdus autotrophica TaxID=1706046 RepID=A0A4R3Y2F9_9PROT|nr:energy-coupling factor ABC transporter permease [Sulfurirhabdus autotrophica]TCV85886.1 putative membrane protein [Sulfurirhabdus autotrophica]